MDRSEVIPTCWCGSQSVRVCGLELPPMESFPTFKGLEKCERPLCADHECKYIETRSDLGGSHYFKGVLQFRAWEASREALRRREDDDRRESLQKEKSWTK